MKEKKHVLIVNQHGENRGDESALRAMLDGVSKRLGGDVKFTVIVQFQDTSLLLPFEHEVDQLHMKMPVSQFLLMFLFTILKIFRINIPVLLNESTRKIVAAYNECNVVVSAPGGPYFGDIYANHEIVHWYYIWLGHIFKKPLFLYAPSAGPFNKKILNLIRKYFFKKFEVICLREDISKGYLQQLLGLNQEIIVTADSAIQQTVQPLDRDKYFAGKLGYKENKLLVAVSAIEYKFPGEENPVEKKATYTSAIIECLSYLAGKHDCYFLFIPQLYGRVHSDVTYLEMLTDKLPDKAAWEIVDKDFNSDIQRAIFTMSDLCISSRYHPQIFAGSSGVPGICVYYEHKALGFMKILGMEDFAFDIRHLDVESMKTKLQLSIDMKDTLTNKMLENIIPVRKKAELTSELLVQLIQGAEK